MLSIIFQLSERLKYVHILNKDAIKIIKEFDNPNILFVCDSPYPCTESYYLHDFSGRHHELAATLKNIKGKFIYCCRVTCPKSCQKKSTCSIKMAGRIKKLYRSNRNYYIDVLLNNGQKERIITNFKFDNSKQYK